MTEVAASAVRFADGVNNSLTNHGNVTTAAGAAGTAISGTGGNEVIDNFGIITGAVDLGTGVNSFHNERDASFNLGTTVNLGSGNLLTNDGTVAPGGAGNVMTSSVAGSLAQATTGIYALDVNQATGTADQLDVSGTASLAGQVRPSSMNSGYAKPGFHQLTILSGAGGVTQSSLSLDAQPSAVVHYQLLSPDSTHLALGYSVDFSPVGLNPNQAAIGNYINNIQLAGSSAAFAPVTAYLFDLPDSHSLAAAYNRLSPEPHLEPMTGTLFSSIQFSNALHSCGSREGPDRFVRESDCRWGRATVTGARQGQTDSHLGFKRQALNVAGGAQRAIGDRTLHLGYGLSLEDSLLDVGDGLADTSGHQIQGGLVVKKQLGATILAADVSAGYGAYDSTRVVGVPTPSVAASSTQHANFAAGHLRLAHAFEQGGTWYLKPMVDAGATYARFPDFQEKGAGGANLDISSHNETFVTISPALEAGMERVLADGTLVRPYAKLGATHFLAGAAPEIVASFQGAPAGVAPFSVNGDIDKTYADVEAGLDVMGTDRAVVRAGYVGHYSNTVQSFSATIKLSIPF
ncbi:MAG: autotransporter domain-containing protein [Gammaproteobacteria bacterium]